MRYLTLALGLALLAAPALGETRIRIVLASPEAGDASIPLVEALLAGLAGDHKGCPVMFVGTGEVPLTIAHVPGPPAGWSVWLGPDDAPLFALDGPAGETAAEEVLDWLCRQGGAEAAAGL